MWKNQNFAESYSGSTLVRMCADSVGQPGLTFDRTWPRFQQKLECQVALKNMLCSPEPSKVRTWRSSEMYKKFQRKNEKSFISIILPWKLIKVKYVTCEKKRSHVKEWQPLKRSNQNISHDNQMKVTRHFFERGDLLKEGINFQTS